MTLESKTLHHMKTWFPVVCVVSLYILTFVLVLPIRMKDKVYSSYFRYNNSDPSIIRRATEKNAERLTVANHYLDTYINTLKDINQKQIIPTGSTGIDITIGIITIQRTAAQHNNYNLGYMTQVVAAFHRLAKQDTIFKTKNIFICNVDPAGENYKEVGRYSSIVDVAVKYRAGSTNQPIFKNWDKFDKEKSDYQFCLNHSTSYGTPFVLLVEDDAIPKNDFFTLISRELLEKRVPDHHNTAMERPMDSVGFIKLYYPEKWTGYSSELTHVLELLVAAFVGGTVFLVTFIFWLSIERTRRKTRSAYVIAFLCGALYGFMLTRTIGRPYILKFLADNFNYYRMVPAKGCCTQAVLYPRKSAARLVEYLAGVKCDYKYSVDIAIDKYAVSNNLRTWLVEPNLVQHIGMQSTVRQHSKMAAEFI